jgi:LysM repeat protein
MNFGFRLFARVLPLAAVLLAFAGRAAAQDVGAIVAGLREDIRILDERTRALTMEIEQLKRENRALREQAGAGQYVTLAQFNTALADLEKALRAGDKEVAVQMTQQLERLAKQTQAAIDTVAKSAGARTGGSPSIQFTEDYPKQGTTYTVQPGDTLDSIARRFNSSIRDIQNANKITDPRSLQAGQTLFIPQR